VDRAALERANYGAEPNSTSSSSSAMMILADDHDFVLWDVDISGVVAEKFSLPIEAPRPRRKQRFEKPLVCSIVAVPLRRGLPSISDQ
jgi:hypothetical protein